MNGKPLIWATDASGAVRCAKMGLVTVIVDVIDMSTSLEAGLQAGAALALGVSPINCNCPVEVNPIKVAAYAVNFAQKNKTEIIIVTEPRTGTDYRRQMTASKVMEAITNLGGKIEAVIPNMGGEIGKLANFHSKVVVAVTATGGTAFDAAFNILPDDRVITGTIARVRGYKSLEIVDLVLKRIMDRAARHRTGVGLVAASKNSLEDVLAARYLWERLFQ